MQYIGDQFTSSFDMLIKLLLIVFNASWDISDFIYNHIHIDAKEKHAIKPINITVLSSYLLQQNSYFCKIGISAFLIGRPIIIFFLHILEKYYLKRQKNLIT